MKLRIGTRGSKLALWQAEFVKSGLLAFFPSLETRIIKIRTTGDINLSDNLSQIGGKGVFVKEIEEALLDKRIDIAVHSLKDVPSVLPEGLCIGSVLKRHNPFDAFISKKSVTIDNMPPGSVVATGSERRKYQLLKSYPELKVVPVRGNVDTRLRKLQDENLDALVLAAAGLERLGLESEITQIFDTELMVPSPCQGIIGIECRTDDENTLGFLEKLTDKNTAYCADLERSFLKSFGGDCTVPLGCFSTIDGRHINAKAVYVDIDQNRIIRKEKRALIEEAAATGISLSESIKNEL